MHVVGHFSRQSNNQTPVEGSSHNLIRTHLRHHAMSCVSLCVSTIPNSWGSGWRPGRHNESQLDVHKHYMNYPPSGKPPLRGGRTPSMLPHSWGMGSIHLLYKHRNSNHQNISKFRLFSVFSFFLTYVSRHFALPFCLLWSFQPWCICRHAMPVVWPSLAHKCSANRQDQAIVECAFDTHRDTFWTRRLQQLRYGINATSLCRPRTPFPIRCVASTMCANSRNVMHPPHPTPHPKWAWLHVRTSIRRHKTNSSKRVVLANKSHVASKRKNCFVNHSAILHTSLCLLNCVWFIPLGLINILDVVYRTMQTKHPQAA